MARGASWFVALAALTLIAVSLGSYFYHRRQLDSIAARHLRLVVTGSGELQVGMPSVYNLLATTVTGEPWAAPVEWSLSTPDGKRLVDRKETTDDQGRLTMIVPADMDLPTRSHGPAELTVTAGGGAATRRASPCRCPSGRHVISPGSGSTAAVIGQAKRFTIAR